MNFIVPSNPNLSVMVRYSMILRSGVFCQYKSVCFILKGSTDGNIQKFIHVISFERCTVEGFENSSSITDNIIASLNFSCSRQLS